MHNISKKKLVWFAHDCKDVEFPTNNLIMEYIFNTKANRGVCSESYTTLQYPAKRMLCNYPV
jgi:hypothetical protein